MCGGILWDSLGRFGFGIAVESLKVKKRGVDAAGGIGFHRYFIFSMEINSRWRRMDETGRMFKRLPINSAVT